MTIFAGYDRNGLGTASQVLLVVAGVSIAVSGCTRLGGFGQTANSGQPQAATPLRPAPLSPVRETTLKPVDPNPSATQQAPAAQPAPQPTEQPAPKPVETAKVDPAAGAKPVTRDALVGAWTVSTGGSNCQIFLALTKWAGGFRAASRGCTAPAIKDVQAWDVKGKQVVLVDSKGASAATLFRSNESRFDGSTAGGGAISFSR